jgi:hypothetical protein
MIFIFIFIFILIYIIFYKLNFICKKYNIKKIHNELFTNSSRKNKYCCIYAYYEKDDLYKDNFIFFLKNGILEDVDYYIVINGNCTVDTSLYVKKENIIIYNRENIGYDFGAYSYAIKKLIKKYDYYFFLNTSIRGPYLKKNNQKWTVDFLNLFNDENVKVVGTSINIFTTNNFNEYDLTKIYNKKSPFTHIQSMFFCIDNEYFDYLNKINFFNEEEMNNAKNIEYIIAHKEIGLSQNALNNNWNINCILSKYKNINYLKLDRDINNTSYYGDPYYKKSYFGKDIDKYEVIFYKNNRY